MDSRTGNVYPQDDIARLIKEEELDKEYLLPVSTSQMTEKQKKLYNAGSNPVVSLNDNRSKLGKMRIKARKKNKAAKKSRRKNR